MCGSAVVVTFVPFVEYGVEYGSAVVATLATSAVYGRADAVLSEVYDTGELPPSVVYGGGEVEPPVW